MAGGMEGRGREPRIQNPGSQMLPNCRSNLYRTRPGIENQMVNNSRPAPGAVFFCLSAFCISPHVPKALSFNFSPYTSREKITPAFQPYKFTSESFRKFFSINYQGKIARFHIRHSGTFCAPSASGGIHPHPGRQEPTTGLWRPYRRPRLANYIAGRGRFAVSLRFL